LQYEVTSEALIVTDPGAAVLEVESTVLPLSFSSRGGIWSVEEPIRGAYRVFLKPGVHTMEVHAKGYLPLRLDRWNAVPKSGRRIRVTALERPSGKGMLRLASTPPGARLRLNGIELAQPTPVTLSDQPAVEYQIRFFGLVGYGELDTVAAVQAGAETGVSVQLPRLVVELQVSSEPSGAVVVLDGDTLGRTPLRRVDLSSGDRTLAVLLAGYEPNVQAVRLEAGRPTSVHASLALVTGQLRVSVEPAGAVVYVDEERLGASGGAALERGGLPPGEHTVRAELAGYESAHQTVQVIGGSTGVVQLRLTRQTGSLYVLSSPVSAAVEVSGRRGQTPARIDGLVPGAQQMRVRASGFAVLDTTVTVEALATTTMSVRLREEEESSVPGTPGGQPSSGVGPAGALGDAGARPAGQVQTFELGNGVAMEFVWVPAGAFTMGSPSREAGRENWEGPQHEVTITRGFWLGRTEVTQGQWQGLMGTTPWVGQQWVQSNTRHPAVYISREDVQGLVDRLNQSAGDSLYRLPTEAEWEYACRAGTSTRWSFGDHGSQLDNYAWYGGNAWDVGMQYAQPVGLKLANPWGLYDVHGNVWEWCQDWYGAYSRAAQTDSRGPVTGSGRVLRGGGFSNAAQSTRSASRYVYTPDTRSLFIGARLLRTP
jgi:formylglycine-generating enzyme required for sulfatase activity